MRKLGLDEAQNIPRSRCQTDHSVLHVMSAAAKTLGIMATRRMRVAQGASFQVGLLTARPARRRRSSSRLSRPGPHGGGQRVATKYLARPEASTVGLFGTGKKHALSFWPSSRFRAIKHVSVLFTHEEHPPRLLRRDDAALSMPRRAGAAPRGCSTRQGHRHHRHDEPRAGFFGDWLADGTHLNIIGSNYLTKAEIDVAVVRRAKPIFVDSKDQAHLEAGDFRQARDEGFCNGPACASWANWSPAALQAAAAWRDHALQIARPGRRRHCTAAKIVAKAKEVKVGRWIEW